MPENQGEGISRRDLLRKGAVLGGAVVWVTPVVQTLGMGRAFAQTASPVGKDISYIGINVADCGVNGAPFFVKWEDGDWEDSPGAAPQCEDKSSLPEGAPGAGKGFIMDDGPNSSCKLLTVPSEYSACTVTVWVKAGQTCNILVNAQINFGSQTLVCAAEVV